MCCSLAYGPASKGAGRKVVWGAVGRLAARAGWLRGPAGGLPA